MPEVCFPRLPEARVQDWAPGSAGRYPEMRFPIGRRQQEWAGARVPSGLAWRSSGRGLLGSLAGLPGSAVWVTWCDCCTVSPGQLVTDVGIWHLASRLNLWPSQSYLIHIIIFSACVKVGCFIVYSSELWMVIKQVCQANTIYSKYFPLTVFMPYITCNGRPTVRHVSMLRTCVSW